MSQQVVPAGQYTIRISGSQAAYRCDVQSSLLEASEYLGVQGLRAGCRSGGCGVCKVRIESGEVRTGKMSKAHVTENDRQQGVVLACRTYPLSDITLSLVDERVGRAHP